VQRVRVHGIEGLDGTHNHTHVSIHKKASQTMQMAIRVKEVNQGDIEARIPKRKYKQI
jgi:hypothetical protein